MTFVCTELCAIFVIGAACVVVWDVVTWNRRHRGRGHPTTWEDDDA